MTVSDLLANLHDLRMGRDDDPPDHGGTTDHGDRHNDEFQDANQEEESPILAHLTKRKEIPPWRFTSRSFENHVSCQEAPPTTILTTKS